MITYAETTGPRAVIVKKKSEAKYERSRALK
jgi:hypothetical protein